ncbi:MAG: hypothetical protein EBX64_08380, partial [Betaproteobacteria bacterium]|nr:hypothetical protein [Betaproteobacteria bacterium]
MEKPRWLFSVPILVWGPQYSRENLSQDGFAAFIVTLMLIPQSLAYATLAGLPPVVGLYASVAPLLVYFFISSSIYAVPGPCEWVCHWAFSWDLSRPTFWRRMIYGAWLLWILALIYWAWWSRPFAVCYR